MALANPEEATNIANEYISSIDNLPNEVQFLLGEIKRKDEQVADIEAKALKKSNDFFGRRTNGPLTPREQAGIEKTREYLERITKLNDEKVQLALDLQRIASRAVGRLDYDLNRIRRATGDLVVDVPPPVLPLPPPQSIRVAPAVPVAQVVAATVNITASTAAPAVPAYTPQIPVQVPEAVVPPPVAQLSAQKRRRLNASASVLANPPNTTPTTPTPAPSVRARPTPQSQSQSHAHAHAHAPSPVPAPRKREAARAAPVEEFDVDEEEDDTPPDEEDNNPYCYCHQPSHGEMVACDGANCPYEWFHLACLGLKHAPKNSKWYCSECSPPDRAADADPQQPEKGRKRR